MDSYDFSGWATRNDIECCDRRIIRKNAFKDQDGATVPLVWMHKHDDLKNVLGHAILENRDEGVYAYCYLNNNDQGLQAKEMIKHGDINALSIYANKLKHIGHDVIHGAIREVSLVLAGANPGAYIDTVVMAHDEDAFEEAMIYNDGEIMIHSDDNAEKKDDSMEENKETIEDVFNTLNEKQKNVAYALIGMALEDAEANEEVRHSEESSDGEETIEDVFNTLNEKQKKAVYAMIGMALDDEAAHSDFDEEDAYMKHNVFDTEVVAEDSFLSHADQEVIIKNAKSGYGTLQKAIEAFENENELEHAAFDGETMGKLLPEYELINPAAPKILYPDDSWVSSVINGVHRSPFARIRTRRADARQAELKAKGYEKGKEKQVMKNINLLSRTTDPQTVYIKDSLDRDDILDITDFDIVAYEWDIMRHQLDQTLAQAILVGDGREVTDPDKIHEDKIRPVWKDEDLYCIHYDVDIAKAKAELQGTETGAHFGENYIYAEAIINAALYSRENYKGSGNLTFYCTPHVLNVMLLARDLNGHRLYSSKNDLIAALDVKDIKTIEQFEGLTRTTDDSKTKKMLGLFVNMADYQLGCVKGGEITKFEQFDIDFNKEKMLLETRVSGALVEWYSAIALEEDVTTQG